MNIPLVSDTRRIISTDYGVLKEDEGIAYRWVWFLNGLVLTFFVGDLWTDIYLNSRGLFIIDDKGILRQITINDLPVGRSVDETLRLVQAFQFTDKHGEGKLMFTSWVLCNCTFNQITTFERKITHSCAEMSGRERTEAYFTSKVCTLIGTEGHINFTSSEMTLDCNKWRIIWYGDILQINQTSAVVACIAAAAVSASLRCNNVSHCGTSSFHLPARTHYRLIFSVCPAGWKPGSDTIKPDVQKSKDFFSKQ